MTSRFLNSTYPKQLVSTRRLNSAYWPLLDALEMRLVSGLAQHVLRKLQ